MEMIHSIDDSVTDDQRDADFAAFLGAENRWL